MGQRATALADRFQQARLSFDSTIEGFTPGQMQALCDAERCTVSALASHMAGVYDAVSGWIATAARGGTMPTLTMDDIDRNNHTQFARDASRDKGVILAELRANGEMAEQAVRRLSDAELDRGIQFSLLGGKATTQQLVENALLAHVESHLRSIRATTETT
jgi:hypothetical protein